MTRRRLLTTPLLLAPGALRVLAAKKAKPPEVEVLEVKANRSEGIIKMDGRVRNSSPKTINGLIVLFDFMAPGGAVISTQKCPVDDDALQAGNESGFTAQLIDQVRAVNYAVRAQDRIGRDLRVANTGPFDIE